MATNNGNAGTAATVSPSLLSASINLSDYMYQAYDTPYSSTTLASNIKFTPLLQNNIPLVSVNKVTGLYAEAFVSTGAGPKQVIIAYEGTQLGGSSGPKLFTQGPLFTPAEIVDDAELFAGKKANSFTGSANFAKQVIAVATSDHIKKQNIYVTGHSLGAAEAEYAASQTGLSGVTFAGPGINTTYTNAPGVKPGNVVDYVDAGDPVGNYAADGNNTFTNIVTSKSIKHFGSVNTLTNAPGLASLQTLAGSYAAQNSVLDKAEVAKTIIAEDGQYHLLTHYASDLGQKLYLSDATANSVLGFYPSASPVTSGIDTSYITAALTSGGLSQSSSASSSTGNASVLAASSATSAMGVKAHAG